MGQSFWLRGFSQSASYIVVNVTVTDVSELRKELTVSFSASELVEEENALLKDFRKQAKVPGFRQGKVPETIIRQRFKKGIGEELARKVSQKAFQFAVEDKDLKVHQIVDVAKLEEVDASQDLAVDFTVDLVPDIQLPEYKGLETKAPSTDVSDEEVEQAIERIRRERADFSEVERAAGQGDYVKLSYTGTVDGTAISELIGEDAANRSWGTVENGWEEAGTDEAKTYGVPAIIDGIVGLSAGDTKTITTDYEKDFKIEALQGKSGSYEVTVHEVRERKLPELDEEFLKSIQVESVEALKGQLLDNLEAQKKQKSSEAQRNQIIEHLIGKVETPLPESAIEAETQQVMARIMMENMQRGIAEDDFEKNKAALHAQSAGIAERDVKARFILSKVAETESIEVSNEDLQRAIMNIAMQQRRSPDELVKELREDQNKVRELQGQVLMSKTLDFLVKEAKVETVEGEEAANA